MKDATRLADRIAHNIEATTNYVKYNWKAVLVVIWMMIVTLTLIQQQKVIANASSYNQVANMRMAVDDVRYSVEAMEVDVDKMQRAVTRMDNSIQNMQSTVNRIHTQVRQ
jgi:peptidoglycan hydrolase CwlO-like protein